MGQRPLFCKYDIFSVRRHREEQARVAVRNLPLERLNEDEEALIAEIAASLTMEVPAISDAEIYQTDRQVKLDARRFPNRIVFDSSRPVPIDGTEITIHIPFKGDPSWFEVSPSTHDLSPPLGDIDERKKELLVLFQTDDANFSIKAQIDRTLQSIKQYLEWLRSDVAQTEELTRIARAEIAKRKEVSATHDRIAASTGIPRK